MKCEFEETDACFRFKLPFIFFQIFRKLSQYRFEYTPVMVNLTTIVMSSIIVLDSFS